MLHQRKNKRFSYKSRVQETGEGKSQDAFGAKWNNVKGESKRKANVFTSLPVLVILLLALFVLIYVLEGYIN